MKSRLSTVKNAHAALNRNSPKNTAAPQTIMRKSVSARKNVQSTPHVGSAMHNTTIACASRPKREKSTFGASNCHITPRGRTSARSNAPFAMWRGNT